MNGPIFLDSYVKGPIFLSLREAAYPLGITWIDYDICVTTSKKWVQKFKGQYMNRSTFWIIKYMNGSIFSKTRYMNGVGFEILARTPRTKITPKLPPGPNPRGPVAIQICLLECAGWAEASLGEYARRHIFSRCDSDYWVTRSYSQASIARTSMARLPWLIRTRFWVPTKSFRQLKNTILRKIFSFYHEIDHRGDSNEYTKHTIIV